MHKNNRRRARAITKAQRLRKQEKQAARAVKLLVESATQDDNPQVIMPVALGATIHAGDMLYLSDLQQGCVTTVPPTSPSAAIVSIGTAAGGQTVTSGVVTVRLRDLH